MNSQSMCRDLLGISSLYLYQAAGRVELENIVGGVWATPMGILYKRCMLAPALVTLPRTECAVRELAADIVNPTAQ